MGDRVRWEDEVGSDALTFDDVLLVPAYSAVHPRDVDVRTRFSRRIALNLPVVSSAMDTVTESELAIALAREGGLGVIHKSLAIAEQCAQVERVKRLESGVIADPVTLPPSATPGGSREVVARFHVSGVPITEEGRLQGLIPVKNLEKRIRHPRACKDALGRLRVAAAIGAGGDALERAAELVRAGVDALVVDGAHAHSAGAMKAAGAVRERFPGVDLVMGNVGTFEGARAVADLGADAVKVGTGPGAICTTRVVSGAGMAQLTAVLEAARALEGRDVPIIADGGIKHSGDIVTALAAGAHSVMIGSLFAGTSESPGETVLLEGRSYRVYRGMGSLSAMAAARGSRERYFQEDTEELVKLVPEGIEGRVPFKGPLEQLVFQLLGGLRAGMGYCGVGSIEVLRTRTRFVRISPAGLRESHLHDITITREAPNYGESGRRQERVRGGGSTPDLRRDWTVRRVPGCSLPLRQLEVEVGVQLLDLAHQALEALHGLGVRAGLPGRVQLEQLVLLGAQQLLHRRFVGSAFEVVDLALGQPLRQVERLAAHVGEDLQVAVEAHGQLLDHLGHALVLAVHLLTVGVGEVVVGLAPSDVGLLAGLRAPARALGGAGVVEDAGRNQQEVGVGLVDHVLDARFGRAGEATEHVHVIARQELLRLLDVLGVDERVQQMGEVDVHVLVVAVGVRDQSRLDPAVEQAVDGEVVGRLEIAARLRDLHIVTRVHAAHLPAAESAPARVSTRPGASALQHPFPAGNTCIRHATGASTTCWMRPLEAAAPWPSGGWSGASILRVIWLRRVSGMGVLARSGRVFRVVLHTHSRRRGHASVTKFLRLE